MSVYGENDEGFKVGGIICQRAAKVDNILQEEYLKKQKDTGRDDIEKQLSSLIPVSGGHSESWQLKRLRETIGASEQPLASSSKESQGRNIITQENGKDFCKRECKLYWEDNVLVWMRSGIAIRSFKFGENIRWACWAWFDMEEEWEEGEDVQMKEPLHFSQKNESHQIQRGLCIFLQSSMIIQFPQTGQEYLKRLDFDVMQVFALEVGVLIQRRLEKEDQKQKEKQSNFTSPSPFPQDEEMYALPEEEPLPNLFYLRRPLDEVKPVHIVDNINFCREGGASSKGKVNLTYWTKNAPKLFNLVDENVICVSKFHSKGTRLPYILVTFNKLQHKVRIYVLASNERPMNVQKKNMRATPSAAKSFHRAAGESSFQPRFSQTEKRPRISSALRGRTPSQRMNSRLDSNNQNSRLSLRMSMGNGIKGSKSDDLVEGAIMMDRNRTSSSGSNIRRISMGLPSRQEESDSMIEDAKGMDEVMQLLDEFDAVAEGDEDYLPQPPIPPPQSVARRPNAYMRRRSSRIPTNTSQAIVGPSQNAAMAGNTISHIMRTPFSKGTIQMGEEVHASRPRISSFGLKATSGNTHTTTSDINADPFLISEGFRPSATPMAASLSQKDENSKLTQNINHMNRSTILRGEGLERFSQIGKGGLFSIDAEDLETDFFDSGDRTVQVHAAVSLLDEVVYADGYREEDEEDGDKSRRADLSKSIAVTITDLDHKSSIISIKISKEGRIIERILKSLPSSDGNEHFISKLSSEDGVQKIRDSPLQPRDHLVKDVLDFCSKHSDSEFATILNERWSTAFRKVKSASNLEWPILESILMSHRDVVAADYQESSASPWESMLRKASKEYGYLTSKPYWLPPLEGQHSNNMQQQPLGGSSDNPVEADLRSIATSLNLIAQELRLDTKRINTDFERIGCLLLKLAIKLNWPKWIDYWARKVVLHTPLPEMSSLPENHESNDEPEIYDIYDDLQDLLRGNLKTSSSSSSTTRERSNKVLAVYSALNKPIKSYTLMSGKTSEAAHSRSRNMVEAMLKDGIDDKFLQSLPLVIALPLLEACHTCRSDPPIRWNRLAYQFVGRFDLFMQLSKLRATEEGPKKDDEVKRVRASKTLLRFDSPNLPQICFQLFSKDHRLTDVANMLQTSRAVATRGPIETNSNGQQIDEDILTEQQKQTYVSISDRLKATSVGRAMFLLSSEPFQMASHIKISPICLRIKMLSHSMVQHREPDAESAEMEWPEFHNGVSAALQLSTEDVQVESSWIYSQTSSGFSSRNAGFILGLGLQGQLRNLGKIHAHYYLSNRHLSTTVGLLLGISISFVGSCDVMAKALMSIHLIHTLPIHSKPLKTTMIEQSAALVGLGFIFMGSNDRWASRMALRALGTNLVMTDDSQIARRECFSLSAGFSLGLVCLGKGTEIASGDIERDIVPQLEKVIIRFSENSSEDSSNRTNTKDHLNKFSQSSTKNFSSFEWRPDISITTSPASIALALIFLRSNRMDILQKLPLPDHISQLDDLRPDILQIRVLCRSMIMWDSIKATEEWLNSVVPSFMQSFNPNQKGSQSESLQLAFWNMRVGAIFAIGLKYAGSNDSMVKQCLLNQFSLFQNKLALRPVSFFEKVLQHLIRSAIDTILTSLSMVAAGSGDVEILKLIRKTLFKMDQMHYGNYMASTMGMGMLFLGGGRFTLGSSNLSIAALLISFYPLYPLNAQDNRAHLQAYRHFWIVAADSRLLSVQDVENGKTSSTPIELLLKEENLKMKGGNDEINFIQQTTPCVLPELDKLDTIRISSNRFLPGAMEVMRNVLHRRTLLESQTMFAMRFEANLSHEDDLLGCASLFEHRKGLQTEMNLPDTKILPENLATIQTWQDEIQSLASEIKTLVDRPIIVNTIETIANLIRIEKEENDLKSQTKEEIALQLFMLRSMMLCLKDDTMIIWPHLITLYLRTRSAIDAIKSINGGIKLNQSEQSFSNDLMFLQSNMDFISKQLVNDTRQPLISSNFVHNLSLQIQRDLATGISNNDEVQTALSEYAKGYTKSFDSLQFAKDSIKISLLLNYGRIPSENSLREIYHYFTEMTTQKDSLREKLEHIELIARRSGLNYESSIMNNLVRFWTM